MLKPAIYMGYSLVPLLFLELVHAIFVLDRGFLYPLLIDISTLSAALVLILTFGHQSMPAAIAFPTLVPSNLNAILILDSHHNQVRITEG